MGNAILHNFLIHYSLGLTQQNSPRSLSRQCHSHGLHTTAMIGFVTDAAANMSLAQQLFCERDELVSLTSVSK